MSPCRPTVMKGQSAAFSALPPANLGPSSCTPKQKDDWQIQVPRGNQHGGTGSPGETRQCRDDASKCPATHRCPYRNDAQRRATGATAVLPKAVACFLGLIVHADRGGRCVVNSVLSTKSCSPRRRKAVGRVEFDAPYLCGRSLLNFLVFGAIPAMDGRTRVEEQLRTISTAARNNNFNAVLPCGCQRPRVSSSSGPAMLTSCATHWRSTGPTTTLYSAHRARGHDSAKYISSAQALGSTRLK